MLTSLSPIESSHEVIEYNDLKQRIIDYHQSGLYEQDIALILEQAKNDLTLLLNSMPQQAAKPAVILDLDETSITNFKSLKKYQFNDCDEVWHKILAETEVEPILPTVAFYQYLRQIKIDVFFISARWCEYRVQTQKVLAYAGFSDYHGLTLLPPKFNSHQYSNFKTAARRKIVQQGYTLLMNIGDKHSDLTNSEAPLNIKLPNYLY